MVNLLMKLFDRLRLTNAVRLERPLDFENRVLSKVKTFTVMSSIRL